MKLLILTAILCNICFCVFPAAGNIDSNSLISQKKAVHKEKIKQNKVKKNAKGGSCSIKKCSIA